VYRFFYPDFVRGRGALALLALRVVVGAAFIMHGLPKLQKPFTWMDGMPNPAPGFMQAVAAVSEVVGGAALILGILTPLAALLIAGVMIAALTLYHLPEGHPFVAAPKEDSFELAAVYLCCCLIFLLVGPGILSLDAWFFRKRRKTF
jgi:putative oxidoreductase